MMCCVHHYVCACVCWQTSVLTFDLWQEKEVREDMTFGQLIASVRREDLNLDLLQSWYLQDKSKGKPPEGISAAHDCRLRLSQQGSKCSSIMCIACYICT